MNFNKDIIKYLAHGYNFASITILCLVLAVLPQNETFANGCSGSTFYIEYSPACGCWQVCGNYISDCSSVESLDWDFGDGMGTATGENPCYTYQAPGTYVVTMTVTAWCHVSPFNLTTTTCNIQAPYTVTAAQINDPGVQASFTVDTTCRGTVTNFTNTTVGASSFIWDFGDGNTSTDPNPGFTFDSCGTYDVMLIAVDNSTCCPIADYDTTIHTVYINCNPNENANEGGDTSNYIFESIASIEYDTVCHQDPTPFTLVAHDSIIGWSWSFSDYGSSAQRDPTHVYDSCNQEGIGVSLTVIDIRGCQGTIDRDVMIYCPIIISNVVENEKCGFGDGSILVNTIGGGGVFDYSIDGGQSWQSSNFFDSLSAGVYPVHVRDVNGACSDMDTAIVQNDPGPLLEVDDQQNVLCFADSNGLIDVHGSSGNGPYTYEWSTGNQTDAIDSLPAGDYSVTVTDFDGCTFADTMSITEPMEFIGTVDIYDVTCFGWTNGSAVLPMQGGTYPNTFIWSNWTTSDTASLNENLVPGTYYVTATDANGCVYMDSAVITQPDEITATITTVDANCGVDDGSATVNVSGGTGPFNYTWDPNANNQVTPTATNLYGGIYNVIVEEDTIPGCSQTFYATVANLGAETITMSQTDLSCYGDCDGQAVVTITGGCQNPPCTFEWFDASTGLPLNDTDSIAGNLCVGDYFVEVNNDINCLSYGNVTIIEPDSISVSEVITEISCAGQCDASISLTATGGTPGYDYQWMDSSGTTIGTNDPNINGLCPGDYSVIVTDVNGCADSFAYTIPGLSFSASISGNEILCHGACTGMATVTVVGGLSPYNYQWYDSTGAAIPSSNSPSLSGLCAGTYDVDIEDQNGCTISLSITFTEPPQIVTSISGTNLLCAGECFGTGTAMILGGTPPYNYQWTDSSGRFIRGETTNTIDSLCAGTYFLEVYDSLGCYAGPLSLTIVEPLPLSLTGVSTNLQCYNDSSGAVDITPTGGSGTLSYSWNNGSATEDLDSLSAGNYRVTVTDTNGCTITGAFPVTQPGEFTDSIFSSDLSCYEADDGAVTLLITGGTGPFQYTWSPNVSVDSLASGLAAGTYDVTIEDNSGCMLTNSITLYQPPPIFDSLWAEVDGPLDVTCFGGTQNDTVRVTGWGGIQPLSYQWSDPSASTDTYFVRPVAGTYYVTVTDSIGCSIVDSIAFLTEPDSMTVALAATDVACAGDSTGSLSAVVTGGNPPYLYAWQGDNDTVPFNTTDSVTNLTADNYTIYVFDPYGCFVSDSIRVDEPEPITTSDSVSDYNGFNVSCYGASDGTIDLTINGGTPPFTVLWNGQINGEGITGLAAATYYAEITDSAGCLHYDTVTLSQPDSITNMIGIDICEGETFTIGGSSYDTSGTYIDTLTATNGCDSVLTTQLTVHPTYFISRNRGICLGDSLFLGGAQQTTPGTYYDSLTTSGSCDSIIETILSVVNSFDIYDTVDLCDGDSLFAGGAWQTTPGVYYDSATASGGCDSNVVTMLNFYPNYVENLSEVICAGDTFFFNGTPLIDGGSYTDSLSTSNGCDSVVIVDLEVDSVGILDDSLWTCPDEQLLLTAPTGFNSYLWLPGNQVTESISVGPGVYDLIVTDSNNCSGSATYIVQEFDEFGLQAIVDTTTIAIGESVSIEIVSTTGNSISDLIWEPTDWLDCVPNCAQVVSTPEENVTYQIVGWDYNQCVDTVTVSIIVDSFTERSIQIGIPNAFTPNGDGINDFYNISVIGYEYYRLLIFDRWGEKLFETYDPTIGWDGTFRGEKLPPGVYVYYVDIIFIGDIKPENYTKHWKGSITLIR